MSECMKIRLGKSDKFAIIDADDWGKVKDYYWRLDVRGYVSGEIKNHMRGQGRKRHARLHRLVMDAKEGEIIDHFLRGDKLDNRKCALRIASVSENNQNTKPKTLSGFKGVHPSSNNRKNPFYSTAVFGGKRKFLGYFQNPEDAAIAYDNFIIKTYGEKAKYQTLNFPERFWISKAIGQESLFNLVDAPLTQMEFGL